MKSTLFSLFSFFLCDNLLLQKNVQSLCENTVFLCVNLIDPLGESGEMGRGNHFELVVHRVVQYDARKYPDEMVSKGQAFQGEFLVLFRRFSQSESVGFGFGFGSGPRSKPKTEIHLACFFFS